MTTVNCGATVCRDAYDLWTILGRDTVDAALLPDLLTRKCALRKVTYATTADFLTPALQAVARAECARQLLPFVPDAPAVDQVLDELTHMLAALRLDVKPDPPPLPPA